jgi:hypothetical protein
MMCYVNGLRTPARWIALHSLVHVDHLSVVGGLYAVQLSFVRTDIPNMAQSYDRGETYPCRGLYVESSASERASSG